jgi:hypothetical protein
VANVDFSSLLAIRPLPAVAAAFATKARQPLNAEMSRAPSTAAGSTRKPFTPRPSARRTVPIDIGGGIAATNLPNAAAGSAQISSSMDDPVPASMRSMPGFGGAVSSA